MANRDLTKSIIEQAYEARRLGNIESVIALFHPNARFEIVGFKDQDTVTGNAEGHSEFRATLTKLIAVFEFVERKVLTMVIEDNQAAVHSRVKLRFIPKDKTVTTDLLDLWRLQDGKVVELLEFADTALVSDMMDS